MSKTRILNVPQEIGQDPLTYVEGEFGSEPVRIFVHSEDESWIVVLVETGIADLATAVRAYQIQVEEHECAGCTNPVEGRAVEIGAVHGWPTNEPTCLLCMRQAQWAARRSMGIEEIDNEFEADLFREGDDE